MSPAVAFLIAFAAWSATLARGRAGAVANGRPMSAPGTAHWQYLVAAALPAGFAVGLLVNGPGRFGVAPALAAGILALARGVRHLNHWVDQ